MGYKQYWPESAVREFSILNDVIENCEAELERERAARRIVDKALMIAIKQIKDQEENSIMVEKKENIRLKYPVIIRYGEDQFYAPMGAEFFLDEHGVQWVKFFPDNGYHRGKENMMRTENITVIRDRERERRMAAHE